MSLKDDTYCGKKCICCNLYGNDKCYGCKENSNEEIIKQSAITDSGKTKYNWFCDIAMCCREKELESCMQCKSSYTCPNYNNKNIMYSIIEAKMKAWGIGGYGLKESVPYQIFIMVCFLLEIISGAAPTAQLGMAIKISIPIVLTIVSAYAYNKLMMYSLYFSPIVYLTIGCQLFKTINMFVYGNVFFAPLKIIIFFFITGLSIVRYKIIFTAFADMISVLSFDMEERWNRLWKFTAGIYALSIIASWMFVKELNSSLEIGLIIPTLIINCVAFVLMIFNIKICEK